MSIENIVIVGGGSARWHNSSLSKLHIYDYLKNRGIIKQ
jgi:hypothetical protein